MNRFLALLAIASATVHAADTLEGAGATFPAPLYQKWIAAFLEHAPGFTVNYNPVGSGEGVELLKNGKADFAGSDAPLTDAELAALPMKVAHIPTVVGGVVPIYHIDGVVRDLRFSPQALAGIYLGKIRRWDDPLIKADNRGVALPSRPIVVVHRSDRSGTTYVWTDFLAKTDSEWSTRVGVGAGISWPVGLGAAGNQGVVSAVQATPDSIGYVEFFYALGAHLSFGSVRNPSGRFIQADLNSLQAAAASATFPADGDLRVLITNTAQQRAYPVASFTYLLVPLQFSNVEKGKDMARFLNWILTSGQKQSAALGYAALPENIAKRVLDVASGIR